MKKFLLIAALLISTFALPICTLRVLTQTLKNGTVGVPYPTATINFEGGVGPFTCTSTGALPPGLGLGSSTCQITGTPTLAGNYCFTVGVTDSEAIPVTATMYYCVNIAPASNFTFTTSALPNGIQGQTYAPTIQLSGGVLPITACTITSGGLPTGLSIVVSGSACAFSGTASATGSFTFRAQATDSASHTATHDYSITIGVTPTVTLNSIAITPASPTITAGSTQQFTATGTFSDNSTADITSTSTWSSATTAAATINASTGLATAVAAGSSVITATKSGKSATTTITVLASGTQHVKVFVPFAPAPGTTNYPKFKSLIIPSSLVDGLTPFVYWNHVETCKAATPGDPADPCYKWTALDTQLSDYVAAGKKAGLALVAQPYGGNSGPNASPSWLTGMSGVHYMTTCSGYSNYLVLFETAARTEYKNFIKAVIRHYSSNVTINAITIHPSDIAYLRYGISIGDEAYFPCLTTLKPYMGAVSDTQSYIQSYAADMSSTIAGYKSTYSVPFDINPPSTATDCSIASGSQSCAVFFDQDAAKHGFMFGSHGLEASDITNYAAGKTTTGDWARQFDLDYALTAPYTINVGKLLQTLCLSVPAGGSAAVASGFPCYKNNATGPLPPLLTFAKNRHTTIVEIYPDDMYVALDSNNVNYSCCHTAYVNAINSIR